MTEKKTIICKPDNDNLHKNMRVYKSLVGTQRNVLAKIQSEGHRSFRERKLDKKILKELDRLMEEYNYGQPDSPSQSPNPLD